MQKISPYIFPLIVTAIVFFLVYRWFDARGDITDTLDYGEGIEIENLSESEATDILQGVGDLETAELEAPEAAEPGAEPSRGTIRYEIAEDRVRFSISAALPDATQTYRAWIRTVGEDNLTEAFILTEGKAGYIGSAAVSAELLPLEVVLSTAATREDALDQVILRGIINEEVVTETDEEVSE